MEFRYVLSIVILCIAAIKRTEGRRFTIPYLSDSEWNVHNLAVKDRIAPLHYDLGSNIVSPKVAANSFVDIVTEYFQEQNEYLENQTNQMYIEHEPKTLTQARKRKNLLRKKAFGKNATKEDREAFKLAIKTISYLKKKTKEHRDEKSRAHLEKRFRDNFYDFSKKVCNGSLHEKSPRPTFS